MATGRIEENKIKVEGFTTATAETVNKEEIYRVVAAGVSTAEKTSGVTIESNQAVVRREKYAYVQISELSQSTSVLCSSTTITTKNIKDDTVYLTAIPEFIESYKITRTGRGEYLLEVCRYPNYSEAECGTIVAVGTDIYGNLIVSNEVDVCSSGDDTLGTIELFVVDGGKSHQATVEASETTLLVNYETTGPVITSTLEVLEKSAGLTIESFDKTSGEILVSFQKNENKYKDITYRLTIYGYNEYNDVVISNEFVIVQSRKEESTKFYVEGVRDINWDETAADFIIHYPSSMTDIGIYDCTGGEAVYHGGHDASVNTTINTASVQKVITLVASGKTAAGSVLYAEGSVIQGPGAYILVLCDGEWVQTGTADINHHIQSFTFEYTAMNVSGLTVSANDEFTSNGGVLVLNKANRTVSLTFNKNTGEEDKDYEIKLSGQMANGMEAQAFYNITHEAPPRPDFLIVSGDTQSQGPAEVPSETEVLELTVLYPDDYTNIAVFETTTNTTQFKIYNTTLTKVSDGEYTLLCDVYQNTGLEMAEYTITVSGTTPENKTAYTNEFVIYHDIDSGLGTLQFVEEEGEAASEDSSKAGIRFVYTNLVNVYVDSCTASDGVTVTVPELTYENGEGTLTLNFPAYPPATRIITVNLKGLDLKNRTVPYVGECIYTLTQGGSGLVGISISPNPVVLETNLDLETFSYDVNYVGVTPEQPIYNSLTFANVGYNQGSNTAMILVKNETLDVVEYTITFRGQQPNGEIISADLVVQQPSRDARPKITISSNESLWNPSIGMYVVGVDSATYNLFVEYKDINSETLSGYTDNPYGSTANPITQKITFDEIKDGTGGEGYKDVTGTVINANNINLAVGNRSHRYVPRLFAITKDTYDYIVHMQYQGEDDVSAVTTVWVTAEDFNGNLVISNKIKFVQAGTTAPDTSNYGNGGHELDMTLSAYTTPYYSGNYGLYGYNAIAPISSTNDDVFMNDNKWGVIKKTYRGNVIQSNLRVSATDNGSSEFWICDTKSPAVVEMHHGTFGTLNVHGYVFRNSVVNNERELLYVIVTGQTAGGQVVSRKVARIPSPVAYIDWGSDYYDPVPDAGGNVVLGLNIRNIDVSSLQFTAVSPEFDRFSFDPGAMTNVTDLYNGGKYQKLNVRVTMKANTTPGSHIKTFKVSGTSTTDGSTVESTFTVWQGSFTV